MTKRILIWGARATAAPAKPLAESFERSGQNFGNVLIGNAVHEFLSSGNLLSMTDVKSPQEANECCDHCVIAAANFLWKGFDMGYMADFLEKTSLPVTIIGVGAQSNDRNVTSQVHPGTLRLMRLISERSKSLGVRGYYTAEVLAANGINNVTVIGCPSLYTTRRPTVTVDVSKLHSIDKLSVNFSRRVCRHAFKPDRLRRIENSLLALALTKTSTFVAQDELEELSFAETGEGNTEPFTTYFSETEKGKVLQFFREKSLYFCDYRSWASHILTQSASIGSRFHGNLIALINGIPALSIVHDSRTMEMSTLMGIPMIHLNDVGDAPLSPEALLDKLVSASYGRFEMNYADLYRRFVRFLEENGLPHNLPLAAGP